MLVMLEKAQKSPLTHSLCYHSDNNCLGIVHNDDFVVLRTDVILVKATTHCLRQQVVASVRRITILAIINSMPVIGVPEYALCDSS